MKKVIPTKLFYGLMWLLFAGNVALALYWVVTDSGLYHPLADATDSLSIGFFATLVVLLSAQFVVTLPLRALAKVPSVEDRLAVLAKR
jgi:hypothetical protein